MTSASRSTVRDDFVTFMLINILTANIYYFNNKKSTRVMCSAVLFIQLSYFFFRCLMYSTAFIKFLDR